MDRAGVGRWRVGGADSESYQFRVPRPTNSGKDSLLHRAYAKSNCCMMGPGLIKTARADRLTTRIFLFLEFEFLKIKGNANKPSPTICRSSDLVES
jgi:hypothetical protein